MKVGALIFEGRREHGKVVERQKDGEALEQAALRYM